MFRSQKEIEREYCYVGLSVNLEVIVELLRKNHEHQIMNNYFMTIVKIGYRLFPKY